MSEISGHERHYYYKNLLLIGSKNFILIKEDKDAPEPATRQMPGISETHSSHLPLIHEKTCY